MDLQNRKRVMEGELDKMPQVDKSLKSRDRKRDLEDKLEETQRDIAR
jgi:hypothetical protein